MKKTLAILAALTMLMAMASCGGDPDTTSSAGTSSTTSVSSAPVSTETSSQVISIESVEIPEEVDNNLAHLEGATYVDMNTGKTAEDEDYIAYYQNADAAVTLESAFDGNNTTGWQTTENFGDAVTEEDVNASEDPSLYWQSALDTTQWFLKPTYEDGTMWLGVTFEEAVTANLIVIDWENGSAAHTVEEGGYYLQYTEDGTEWKNLEVTVTRDTETLEGHYYDNAEFEAVEATGFRCVILKTTSKYAPKVWEMEIYAPEEEATEESTVAE